MEKAKAMAAPFKKGVNLTNWLEHRPVEKVDEDLFSKKDFENIKSMGCDVVRLPIHFERFCFAENDYKIPEKIWHILDHVVEWVTDLSMYVIFDFHNATDAESFTPVDVEKVLNPVWTQMAERYKDATEYLIFEIMNEPHGIEIPIWNEIIFRVHKLIRSIDTKHYVVVGGADWNSTKAMKTLPDFKDDKVIYTFHFYDPHTFTHQGAPWCHMERVRNIPFPYDPEKMPPLPENPTEVEIKCFEEYPEKGTLEAVKAYFDEYAVFSAQRNAPVYCGEFGCSAICVGQKEREYWYRTITSLLEERGISRTSWDYYGSFGVFTIDWGAMESKGSRKPEFPEDVNQGIIEAMGLHMPQ